MRLFIRGSYADASDCAVFPVAVNKIEQLDKAVDIISKMDDKTFAQFTELCIQRIRQDNKLQETNSKLIIRTLYLMRAQPDTIINSFMNRGNQNITSSNYYSICHWFPGCNLVVIVGLTLIFAIEIIVLLVDIFFPTMGTFSSHTGDMRRAIK